MIAFILPAVKRLAKNAALCYNKGMSKTPYSIVYSNRRTLGLTIGRDGAVIVRAPRGSSRALIEKFVSDEAGWIEKQLARFEKTEREAVSAGALSPADIKRLAERMRPILNEKLPRYAARLGVTYNRVTIRAQKSKWGSCTREGNLNFNCLLMLAPEEVLDYVIVHELCHRKHMDHSPAFWAEVESVIPEHRRLRKWLKDNGGILMRRMDYGE